MVKQGADFQTRPEWDLWHEKFVHGADTGGVLTIGSECPGITSSAQIYLGIPEQQQELTWLQRQSGLLMYRNYEKYSVLKLRHRDFLGACSP